MKATNGQKAKIHIAKADLNLCDDDYLGILAGYGVGSSSNLTCNEANEVLAIFKRMGWIPKKSTKKKSSFKENNFGHGKTKYNNLSGRDKKYATSKQLRMVEAQWRNISREKTDKSLQRFIQKRTGVTDITFLLKEHVKTVLIAIKQMEKQG